MESGKQGAISPEISSEENNETRSDQANGDTSTQRAGGGGARRSYECTYCKRGFTNAQALGGHMNIHRKNRAKAMKQQNTANSSNISCFSHQSSDQEITPTNSSPSPFSSHHSFPSWYQPTYNINHVDHQSNYYHHHNVYVHDQPYGYSNNYSETSAATSHSLAMNEELMRADLSLQVDSSRYFERDDQGNMGARPRGLVSDELDLELRLGHG